MPLTMVFAFEGLLLGFAAGFSPGPLFAFVIAQSLRFGTREGIKVAFVPFLTDGPAIIISLAAIHSVAGFQTALGIATLLGAGFVLYLAHDSFVATAPDTTAVANAPRSVLRGVLVNILSPHPYLFWLTVGAPATVRAWAVHWTAAALYVACFYGGLVGAKVLVAITVGQSRSHLVRRYGAITRTLAIVLALFALRLLWEGIHLIRT